MQSLEGQFDCCTEQLFEVGLKLEQKEKVILTFILYKSKPIYIGLLHYHVETSNTCLLLLNFSPYSGVQ